MREPAGRVRRAAYVAAALLLFAPLNACRAPLQDTRPRPGAAAVVVGSFSFPESDIVGRAFITIWPLNHLGFL